MIRDLMFHAGDTRGTPEVSDVEDVHSGTRMAAQPR